MKPPLVIFEGCDKSGKTTIFQAFRRKTAYQILCWDRQVGSQIVYDRIYGRPSREAEWFDHERDLQTIYDIGLVTLTAPEYILRSRIEESETGDDLVLALRNFSQADRLFRWYHETSSYPRKILLDTNSSTPDDCVSSILEEFALPALDDPGRIEMSRI